MYHSISDRDERHLRDYFKVCTPPAQFREQMQTLKEVGYVGVDLGTGLAWLRSSPPSPFLNAGSGSVTGPFLSGIRPVVITFDDGYQDFYTEAVPVMREFGFTATMYLPTAYIECERRSFRGIHCMTWNEVKEARRAGMIFGSHTVNHPKLHGMPWDEIETELRDSRRTVEDRLGEVVQDFAYPYAFPEADRDYCERFRSAVGTAGYSTCVTTIIGRLNPKDDPFTLRRLPVNSADDSKLLLAKLNGTYDWMGLVQYFMKQFKQSILHRS